MSGALDGVRVLVTRPRERALELVFLLEDEGAVVCALPLLELLPPQDARPLHAAAERVSRYRWIVFASPSAVSAFADAVREAGTQAGLQQVAIAAVGAQTARTARDRGLAVAVEASGTGADLAQALRGRVHPGDEVLLPCARDARPELAEGLDGLGVALTRVVAYRAEKLAPSAEELAAASSADVVLFASPRTADALLEAMGALARPLLERSAVVAIGPTTAEALKALGVRVDAVASRPSADALVEATIAVARSRGGLSRSPSRSDGGQA